MKRGLCFLVLIGGAVALYFLLRKQPPVLTRGTVALPNIRPAAPLPPGAVLTGRIEQTSTGRPPNFPGEVIGYGVREWAEYALPTGKFDWVEIKPGA